MAYSLILLRHGQSTWNLENVFTGWTDVPLSDRGREEAVAAGKLMQEASVVPDVVHTSLLERAIDTANLALGEMGRGWIPVRRHWRLNERHYGALQGMNKQATTDEFGAEQVHEWRRSYRTPPPAIDRSDDRHPSHDARYAMLPPDVIPSTECLADVVGRMLPYWHDALVPDLRRRQSVLVAAHGNSLRALVMHLDGIDERDIADLNIPTGIPLSYQLDDNLNVIERMYLGDPEVAKAAAAAVAGQAGRQEPQPRGTKS